MKLIDETERVLVPKGVTGYVLHMKVVKECGVDGALAGSQCDAIMLNLTDLARLQMMGPNQIDAWLKMMQTKIRISFDPGVVK